MNALGLGLEKNSFLSRFISNLIKSFKSRVTADSGIFEAENCLKSTLTNLNKI
jgi:hypothetical protein